jgi:putative ABC transport system permease protein
LARVLIKGNEMLNFYLKLAIRNYRKAFLAFLINVLGLSAGFTTVFFAAVWLHNELTYDQFHTNAGDIYLLASKRQSDSEFGPYSPLVFHRPELFESYPEVIANVKVAALDQASVSNVDKSFTANGLAATRLFFETFNFPFIRGTYESFSDSTKVIYLTTKLAGKMFNSTDVVGKVVDFDFGPFDREAFIIGGVLDNPPANSSIKFEFIVPYHAQHHWARQGLDYLRLARNTDVLSFTKKIADIGKFSRYANPETIKSALTPLTDIYFHTSFTEFDHGNIRYIQIILITAIIILLVTIANHINLTSSQAGARFSEWSVRKIIGSQRTDLYYQFVLESFISILSSLVVSAVLIELFAGDFYSIVNKEIRLSEIFRNWGGFLIIVIILVSFLSGLLLARFFNNIKPLKLLKGESLGTLKLSSFKEKLMIIQLIVAIAGVAATLTLNGQLKFMMAKDPGYNRENVVKIGMAGVGFGKKRDEKEKITSYIEGQLNGASYVLDFDLGDFPTDVRQWRWQLDPIRDTDNVGMLMVGSNFFDLFDIKLTDGKAVVKEGPYAVVNESAVKTYQMKTPIGQKITTSVISQWQDYEVVGIVKDFNFESSGLAVKPLVIVCAPYSYRNLVVKIAPGRTSEALKGLEKLHKTVRPGEEFTYQFFDQEFDKIYRRDITLGKIFNIIAVVAVIISTLGVFSLVVLFTREKTREIGIRKVFGAHVYQIVVMIGRHFLKRFLLAHAIGSALSWFALHNWLENFVYRIALGWWIFALSGLLIFILGLLTIGFQTIRAARANPVDSLRND